MKDKILNFISDKMDLSEQRKKRIKNYRKARVKMVNIMIKNGKISKFRLILISQFLTLFLGVHINYCQLV